MRFFLARLTTEEYLEIIDRYSDPEMMQYRIPVWREGGVQVSELTYTQKVYLWRGDLTENELRVLWDEFPGIYSRNQILSTLMFPELQPMDFEEWLNN